MAFSTTSIAFIVLGIGSGIFHLMFRRAFRKQQNAGAGDGRVGKLLSAYFLAFAVATGIILGFGTLMFGGSPEGLFYVLVAFTLAITCLAMLGLYIIHYIFYPESSKVMLLGFAFVLGAIAVFALVASHPLPYVDEGSVIWSASFKSAVPFFYLLLIAVGSGGYIFLRLFRMSRTIDMKILSLVLGLSGIFGAILPALFHLLSYRSSDLVPNYAIDLFLIAIGAILILCFLLLFFLRNKKESIWVMSGVATVLFVIWTVWWLNVDPFVDDPTTYDARMLWSGTYQIIALWGAICGFFVALSWGFRNSVGKAVLFFALSLFAQVFGQSAYSYYGFFKHIEVPYPSLGDIGFSGSILLYIIGILFLAKAGGIKISSSSFFERAIAVVVPLIMLLISYVVLLRGYTFDWSHPLRVFLDFANPLGGAFYVSLAIMVFLLAKRTIGGIMKWPILFVLFALVIHYLCDYSFFYQASRGTFYVAGLSDSSFAFSYFVMTLALASVGRAFIKMQEIEAEK